MGVPLLIPISKPSLGPEVESEVLAVLRSGQLAQGPRVAQLEQAFAELTGCEHAVALSSGTVALELALSTLGLKRGDEVITSPFTFAATLNAIVHAGATARFVDVDENGLLDTSLIQDRITAATRVLVPVHLYGLAVDLTVLRLPPTLILVEDAAQAIGAEVQGQPVGSFGIGCFSLYATKNVTTGEGGIVTTDNAELAERLRLIRNQGMRERYEYLLPGHNYRMTELQAAVGLPQMRRLAETIEMRRRNATVLLDGLADIPGIRLPVVPGGSSHVWHQFTIRVMPEASMSRDILSKRLWDRGIATGIYYPKLVHDHDCYRASDQVQPDSTPRASAMCHEVLSLPVHPGVSDADINHIVNEVRNALGA